MDGANENFFKLFVRHCLFFRSNELFNWVLGVAGWLSLALFLYAVSALIRMIEIWNDV